MDVPVMEEMFRRSYLCPRGDLSTPAHEDHKTLTLIFAPFVSPPQCYFRAVFAWIFSSWALLPVMPIYIYMVRGLEDATFVQEEIKRITAQQAEQRLESPEDLAEAGSASVVANAPAQQRVVAPEASSPIASGKLKEHAV